MPFQNLSQCNQYLLPACTEAEKNLTWTTRNNCFVAQVVTLLSKPKYKHALFHAPWLISEKYAHCLQFQSIYPLSSCLHTGRDHHGPNTNTELINLNWEKQSFKSLLLHLLVESNYHCQELTKHPKISKSIYQISLLEIVESLDRFTIQNL